MEINKVAVTGASGHLGLHIVLALERQGYSTKALYHTAIPKIETKKTEWVNGDVTQSGSIDKLIDGCQVVIHAAGLVQLQNTSRGLVLETNVLGTQNLIDHCLISGRNIRFIHISSTSAVSPFPRHEKMSEDRPYLKTSDYAYAWSKSLSEQLVVKATHENDLDAVIFRPSALLGPLDFKPSIFGSAMLKFLKNEIPAVTTGGYNFIDIRDAAQTIVNSIELGKRGSIYNLGGEYRTMREMNQLLAEISGCRVPNLIVPTSILYLFEPLIRFLYSSQDKDTPFTKENLFFVRNSPTQLDSSKAISELGHKKRPLQETIQDTVEWFKEKNMI